MKKSIATIAVLVTAAVAAGPAMASSPTTIVNCASRAQVKPGELILYCGDAGQTLTRLHWSEWGSATATATAVEVTNTCKPSCVAGKDVSERVEVTASGLEDGRYTKLSVDGTRFNLTVHGPARA